MSRLRLFRLSPSHFLLIALTLVGLATVCGLVVLTPYTIYNLKCEHFDLPGYEATFGFALGDMEAPTTEGGRHTVRAITRLGPTGVLARSGARVGDVPRIHHGIADFCAALAT